jgi:hypothetical protein
VFECSPIVGEAEEVDVLDRERLVCRRSAGREPTFVRPAHRHERRCRVAIDEDVVDLV